MSASVAWISISPVKGLRMQALDQAELTADGIPGDRVFFLVDESSKMISLTRLGPLASVVAEHDPLGGTLALRLPDGGRVEGTVELGEPQPVRFFGIDLEARPVLGGYSAALSELCGTSLRLVRTPPSRPGVDRGHEGATTLLSVASLERLRAEAGEDDPVDPQRFRMTFGVDGVPPHAEDGWIGSAVRMGEAVVRPGGHVGRCAATTRNAETGVVDLQTLHHLKAYRDQVPSAEPLPFGVFARVIEPGLVRRGDPVEVCPA